MRTLVPGMILAVGAWGTAHPAQMQAQPVSGSPETPAASATNSDLATVLANGVELHYLDRGQGVPIVFVHGGLVDYREWEPVAGQLSQDHRTVRYSRRYNYPNRNPLQGPGHSAAVEGEDLAALIRALELGPVHLAGISYGAYSALYTALQYPELVRSLTMVEAPLVDLAQDLPGGDELYREFMAMWGASADAFARSDSVAALRAAVDWFVAPGVFDRLPEDFLARLMSNVAEWRALTTSPAAFGVVTAADLRALTVPVLMITGGRSYPLFRLVDAEVERQLPDVRRIIVPDGTHDVCSEQPRTCAEALRDFIARADHATEPDTGAIAAAIVRRSAGVQPGERVWIAGGSDDVAFMNHLAVAVGAEGGHPIVTLRSNEVLRRWYQEVPERFDAQRDEWLWRLHELADVVIELQSTDLSIFGEIPPERLAAWDAANAGLTDFLKQRGARIVRVGNGLLPSDWRARELGVERADLERAFLAGLLAEPADLASAGERLREVLRDASTVRVRHPNGTDLTVGVGRGDIVVVDGTTSAVSNQPDGVIRSNITWLPGGEVTLALDPERADGRLVVERLFLDGQEIGPLTLTYADGKLQALESDADLSVLRSFIDPAVPLSDRLTGLKFGVNPHITDPRLLPWMGAGIFSLSMGSNVLLGGDLELPFYFFLTLPGATVYVDDRVVVQDGELKP